MARREEAGRAWLGKFSVEPETPRTPGFSAVCGRPDAPESSPRARRFRTAAELRHVCVWFPSRNPFLLPPAARNPGPKTKTKR